MARDVKEPKKSIGLHGIDKPEAMAQKGHLSENKPFEFRRALDEPGRIEELMRKRQSIGSYSRVNRKLKKIVHTPVVLDWKAPKGK